MITRIDSLTAHKIHLILAKCRERGTDPVQALDAAGLVRYPALMEREREMVLRHAINTLHAATPTMLGGGIVPATAADMKRCMLEYIELIIDI